MDLVQFAPFFLFLHVHGGDPGVRADLRLLDHGVDGGQGAAARELQLAPGRGHRQQAGLPAGDLPGDHGRPAPDRALQINPQGQPWLVAGIILYLIAITYALTVQRNALHHLIEMTSTPPPPGTPPGPPPPELLATVKKIQRGGMFLGILIVIIVFLMVVKPGR